MEAEALSAFVGIGLDEKTAKNAVVNPKFCKTLLEVVKEAGVADGCKKSVGNLLYATAGKFPANALRHRPTLLTYVVSEKIKSVPQLEGAFEYLKKVGATDLDTAVLEEASGVGVVVTPEQITQAVARAIADNKAKLLEDRYHFNSNTLLGPVARSLRWADGGLLRAEVTAQVEALLGPKTEADLRPAEKKKKPKAEKAPDATAAAAAAAEAEAAAAEQAAAADVDPFAGMPSPGDNNGVHTSVTFSDGRVMRVANTTAQLAVHLQATGGRVVTRFPPEPNGYLHIGHAKAMFIDFGLAAARDGVCYLRYDDTNPTAEKLEYILHIQEIVKWMGWTPWKITYSSDYFDQLYDFAVQLIKSGHAFVCHQTKAEIEEYREKRLPSPWRDRPVAESLRLFEDMRRGLVDEGAAVLRMKMDHKNENYNMFDQVAYRVMFVEHPHAGDKWCVYPTYDFTHCLVDALENVTHSLCTLEFESRRASYYWLLEVLGTYKPYVWEYARLNVTHNVMSKRKLQALVKTGHVNGWDDPRLLTLAGLRRRGAPAAALNALCRELGVTRNDAMCHLHRLEHHVRQHLDATAPRLLAVLRPLKVVLSNLPEDFFQEVEAARFPGRPSPEPYTLPVTRELFIEETDFRTADAKDYYGLAPGKTVMLRYAFPIKYESHSVDAGGRVTAVTCTALTPGHPDAPRKPPKGVLSWCAPPSPGAAPLAWIARLYAPLFKSPDPAKLGDAWLDDLAPDSLVQLSGCVAPASLAAAEPGHVFQLERLGYFCVDPDTRPGLVVMNRTVTLRDSYAKGGKA